MLNECWQPKSDAANISRSVFEWSPISQDISKYLIFVFDFLSMSLYICSVFMDLCWLIGGSLSNGILNIWLPRGERNPSFPLWGPEVNFLSELVIMICTLYFLTFHKYSVRGVYKDTRIEFQVRLYFRNFLTQGIYLECLHLFLPCFLILGHWKCCHSSVFTMEHTLALLCYGRS